MKQFYLLNTATKQIMCKGSLDEIGQYKKRYYNMLIDSYGLVWANSKLAELSIVSSGMSTKGELYI